MEPTSKYTHTITRTIVAEIRKAIWVRHPIGAGANPADSSYKIFDKIKIL